MKKLVILLAVFALLPTAMATNFEWSINDARGDVNDADIDITKAWTTEKDSNIVFHIQVAGKINNNYYYWIIATNGSEEVGAIYSGGYAIYSGSTYTTSWGQPHTSIENGNTLAIEIPAGIFSSWEHFAFQAFAGKGYMMEGGDFTQQVGDVGGNKGNEGGGNENNMDPVGANPTDKSISVKINNVKYRIEPADSNAVKAYMYVDGTTSGVDHAAIDFVIYYKNGTHDYTSWIVGPIKTSQAYGGYSIYIFFNSTSGSWNKWKYEMNMTYPTTQYEWLYDIWKGKSEVSKVVVYARAFKDAEETKWNQYKYETTPVFSTNAVTYGMSINGNESNEGNEGGGSQEKEKSKTPGFEFVVVAIAIGVAMSIRRRR